MAVTYTDPDTNLAAIDKTANFNTWADELEAILKGVGAFLRAKYADTTVAAPGDHLAYICFGDSARHNWIRVGYDGNNFIIEKNTGSEASPSWGALATVNYTTGAAAFLALTMAGDINMVGNDITNVNTINSISISSHKARHQPGGADALTTGVPVAIGTSNAAGSGPHLALFDHIHQGLLNIRKAGDTKLNGEVTLTGGTNVTLTQSGQDISIAAASHATINRSYTTTAGADQAIGASSIEEAITWAGSTLVAIPGADGAKNYKVSVFVNCTSENTGVSTIRIRQGTSTTVASNTLKFEADWETGTATDGFCRVIPNFRITAPAAGQSLMVTIENATATDLTVYGATTSPAERCSYIYIEEEH